MVNGVCEYCGHMVEAPNRPNQTVVINQYVNNTVNNTVNQRVSVQPRARTVSRPTVSSKSKGTALILCVLLGFWGVHLFYVGRKGLGIVYLFTAGLMGFGWIIDIVMILTGTFKDEYGLPLK